MALKDIDKKLDQLKAIREEALILQGQQEILLEIIKRGVDGEMETIDQLKTYIEGKNIQFEATATNLIERQLEIMKGINDNV
jgi:hypothetical protein